jgi:hypothetical protein
MVSHLRFARINFEQKLDYIQDDSISKITREKKQFLKVISFDLNINKLLEKGQETYEKWRNNQKKGYKPHKIESIEKSIEWQFGDIREKDDFIFGRIAKYKGHVFNIKDEKNKGFKQDLIKEAFLCIFLIDIKRHVLVYESKRNIGELAPKNLIEDVFNSYYGEDSRIGLNLIADERKILDRLDNLDVITKVLLHIKPTNPNSTPSSDQMDKLLKGMNASHATIEVHSTRGIDLKGGKNFLQSGLKLAEEGHGNATVIGSMKTDSQLDGEKKLIAINSLNLPIKESVLLPQDDIEKIKILIEKIIEVEKRLAQP